MHGYLNLNDSMCFQITLDSIKILKILILSPKTKIKTLN